ncbi:TolC family outer membrane protein [Paraburkholderia sp. PREW-6R]|uniref:TolC family outer membrane protein n=1 Tax=Paraburkholderia sp. PREW-6R TaxID=3141544 RepID=UPI0031F5365F
MSKSRLAMGMIGLACALANPAHAADLVSVVQQALGRDSNLAQARAGYAAAQQAVPEARAGLLPQISAGWGRAYNRIDTDGFPGTHYWQSGWTVNIAQPLFDWTKWTAYKQADYVEAHGAVELNAAQQAAILQAVRVYFDALAAEDELTRVNEYAAAVDQHAQWLDRAKAAGEATVIDIRDVETEREQVALQQMDAENRLLAKRRAWEQTTGVPFETLARLPDSLRMPPLVPADVEVWASQAKSHAFDVQLKQLDWQIAKMDVSKAQSAHWPSAYLTGSYTPAGAASGYSRPTTTTTGMLSISIPLYSGGETQAKVQASEALEDKAQQGLSGAMRGAEASARDDYSRYQYGRARVERLTRLVELSRETLAATRVGFRVGERTANDVIRAIDTLYSLQRDLLAARYDAIIALMQLKGDTAALSLTDVVQINDVLVH